MASIKVFVMSVLLATFLTACSNENSSDESPVNDNTIKEENNNLEKENKELKEQITDLETEIEELKSINEVEVDGITDNTSDDKIAENTSGKSRSNPASIGDSITYEFITYDDKSNSIPGNATLTVNEVIRGDDAISIIDTNTLPLEELPEGYEWAVIDFTVKIDEIENSDESVYVWGTDFNIYEDDGSQAPSDIIKTFDNRYRDEELYEGGTASGKLERVVPEEQPFQIRYGNGFNSEEVFITVD